VVVVFEGSTAIPGAAAGGGRGGDSVEEDILKKDEKQTKKRRNKVGIRACLPSITVQWGWLHSEGR